MPLDSFTSEQAFEGLFRWACLKRQREEGEFLAIEEKAEELWHEAKEVNKAVLETVLRTLTEAEEARTAIIAASETARLLSRECDKITPEIQLCNTILRRIVNHSSLIIAKQFPPLLYPFGPRLDICGCCD